MNRCVGCSAVCIMCSDLMKEIFPQDSYRAPEFFEMGTSRFAGYCQRCGSRSWRFLGRWRLFFSSIAIYSMTATATILTTEGCSVVLKILRFIQIMRQPLRTDSIHIDAFNDHPSKVYQPTPQDLSSCYYLRTSDLRHPLHFVRGCNISCDIFCFFST